MAFADVFSSFMSTLTGLQQRQEQNQRADMELQLEKLRTERAFKTADIQRQIMEMNLKHEQAMAPLEEEGKKLDIQRLKDLTGDENLARKLDYQDLLEKNAMKLRLAEESRDPRMQAVLPYLREKQRLVEGAKGQVEANQAPMVAGGQEEQGPPLSGMDEAKPGLQAGGVQPKQAMVQTPSDNVPDTPGWYRNIAKQPPGSIYTTPSGQSFFITGTPEESKQKQSELERMRKQFPDYEPGYGIISGAEAEEKAKAIEMHQQEQQIQQVAMEDQADRARTVQIAPRAQITFQDKGSPTRMSFDENGNATFTGIDMRTIGKDRAAFEQMAETGQLTKSMLRGYDRAVTETFAKAATEVDAEGNPTELARSLVEAEPGQLRINRMQTDDKTQFQINQLKGMGDFLRAHGHEPTMTIRDSKPSEIMNDFGAILPESLKYGRVPVPGTKGIPLAAGAEIRGRIAGYAQRAGAGPLLGGQTMEPAGRRGSAAVAAQPAGKMLAQLSRSIQAMEGQPGMAEDLAIAKQQFNALLQQYDIKGMAGADPNAPTNLPKAVNSILDAAVKRSSKAPAPGPGKSTSQAGGFGPGLPGFARMGATMAALGAQVNVDALNEKYRKVPKEGESGAKSFLRTVNDQWNKMTDQEKNAYRTKWNGAKGTWETEYKVTKDTIKAINDIINPPKK